MSEVKNIPEGWVETTLEAVAEIKYGKDHKHLKDGDIPCLGSGGFMRNVDQILYDKPSVLIPRKGTISNLFFIEQPFWTVDTLFYTKIDESKIIPKYLYFKLKTINLENLNVGSAVPSLTTPVLNQLTIDIPKNITEQQSIAAILTSFDDKIELLRAQNKTLEEMAQTIFTEWFGKYRVDDELPEGWREGVIEDLTVKMNSGGTPSTKEESYYNGNINWFSTKELQDNFIFESDKKITEKGLNNSSAKLFPKDTVIMAIYAAPTVGRLGILNQESAFNQAAVGLVAKNEIGYPFIFLLLKYFRDDFNNLSNGAAQQNLNVGIVKNYKICIPNEETLKYFNDALTPVFEKIRANSIQIQTLTKTRDALLPKLMSGEIRVKM